MFIVRFVTLKDNSEVIMTRCDNESVGMLHNLWIILWFSIIQGEQHHTSPVMDNFSFFKNHIALIDRTLFRPAFLRFWGRD